MFLAALVVRMVHLATIRDSPFFNHLYIDPGFYDEWGLRIAAGQWLSDRPFFLDPLYPYLIGGVYAIFGHSYVAVGILQGVLGALVAPLLFLAARRWYEPPTPSLAGWIAVFYLPAIYFGGIVMKPGLSLFLVTLALFLWSRALAGAGLRTWFASGVVLGLAALTRGNMILLLPVLAVWTVFRSPLDLDDEGKGLREGLLLRLAERSRRLESAALLVGAAAVFVLPAAHNLYVGGEFILTTANAGQNFFIGNNGTNPTGEYQQLPFVDPNPKYEQRDFEREAERRTGRELSDREISGFWFDEGWAWIRSDPVAWGKLLWLKLRGFWGAYEIPDSLDYYLYSRDAPILRLPLPGFGLLGPLALLGAVLSSRTRGWPRLLVIFTVVYSASVVLFFVFSRFRMLVGPALYVFAAFAVVWLARAWLAALSERKGFARPLAATGMFVLCFVFVNVPVRAVPESRGYRLAERLRLPVQRETSANGHFNIGVVYAAEAKIAVEPERWLLLAEEELNQAIALEPQHKKFFVELAKVLARQARNEEAIEAYDRAREIDPFDYRIHHGKGLLHRRLNRLEDAEADFRRSLQARPGFSPSATQLGEVLLERGRPEEAAEMFRYALGQNATDDRARAGLQAAESR
jgi:hypothetical protein